jgi:hypothetical protein
MKTLLVALNSKYIHSNLAIRYLKAYAGELCDIRIEEFTINQRVDSIAAEILKSYLQKPVSYLVARRYPMIRLRYFRVIDL